MTDQPTQEVARREDRSPVQVMTAQIRSPQFMQQVQLALPGNVTPARFVRAAVTALMQNPDLANAEPDSVFTAVIKCAQDGLLPDGRQAALVMFGKKCVYMPMVGGFRQIAAEHGWTIRSQVVYEADEFSYELGLEPTLTHRPAPLRTERGTMIAAYAVGSHKDGRREFEVMNADEIAKVRAVSRASSKGPWVDWEERMWEKTPARRLFAKLPLDKTEDDRIERMLEASKENAADLLYGPDGSTFKATPALPLPADAPPAGAPTMGGDDSDVDQAPAGEGDGQQAGDTAPGEAATVSPVPGDDQDEPTLASAEEPASYVIPEAVINKAAATKVPERRNSRDEILAASGKPLSEVAADASGDQWLAWALRQAAGYWPTTFRASLELFVEHRCGDVWAAYVEERDAA